MKIMILGADGYLGWPTSVDLASKNHRLLLIDNFTKKKLLAQYNRQPLIKNKSINSRIKNLDNKRVKFKNIDCTDYLKLNKAFKDFMPDAVIHYAELPSAPYSMFGYNEGWKTIENNLKSTFNLINCIKGLNPNCHVIKLGTMGEYGTPNIDIEEGWLSVLHKKISVFSVLHKKFDFLRSPLSAYQIDGVWSLPVESSRSPSLLYLTMVSGRSWPWTMMGRTLFLPMLRGW